MKEKDALKCDMHFGASFSLPFLNDFLSVLFRIYVTMKLGNRKGDEAYAQVFFYSFLFHDAHLWRKSR